MIKDIIDPTKHYTIVHIIDVSMGNPNGDPASDNSPRQLPDGRGLITSVSIKRKLRDNVYADHKSESGYDLFVLDDAALNVKIAKNVKNAKENKKDPKDLMLEQFFDVRMFGAVMSTGGDENAGKVKGCLQFNEYVSFDSIDPEHIQISRMAVTTEKDFDKSFHKGTFGEKYIVSYGCYMGVGTFNPHNASENKVSQKDMEYFWEAMCNLFDSNISASRGLMTTQKLYVFEQEATPPYIQSGKIKSLVKVCKKPNIDSPKCFEDYDVQIMPCPERVKMYTLID